MQLAPSSNPPSDPNPFALMFGGATPTAGGPAMPGTPCSLDTGVGFESLLPVEAPMPAATPATTGTVPLDLRGGVPLAFLPAVKNATLPTACEVADVVVALPGEGEADTNGVENPAKPGEVMPKLSPRGARSALRAIAPEVRREIPQNDATEPQPKADASLLVLAGLIPPVPVELAPVELLSVEIETPEEESADIMPDILDDEAPASENGESLVWTKPESHITFALPVRQSRVEHREIPSVEAAGFDAEPEDDKSELTGAPVTASLPKNSDSRALPFSRATLESKPELIATELEPLASRVEVKFGSPLRTNLPLPSSENHATLPANSADQFRAAGEDAAVVLAAEIRPPGALRFGREKIAAAPIENEALPDESIAVPEKTFVTHEWESFTPRRGILGTEDAKSMPTMSAHTFNPPSQSPVSEILPAAVAPVSGLAERIESHNVLTLALDGVRSAHEAVEVVLRTADRLSSLTNKSVRLEFSVGDEKLGVRVELRANEIRTTFHTESAELRGALASEWQSVASSSGQGERTLRILPAQFGGSEQTATNGFSGDASSRHRESPAQPQPDAALEFASAGRNRSSRATRPTTETRSLDTAFAAPGTALHLHTLA